MAVVAGGGSPLKRGRGGEERTVVLLAQVSHDVEGLVALEGLAEQHHLLVGLDAFVLGIGPVGSLDEDHGTT